MFTTGFVDAAPVHFNAGAVIGYVSTFSDDCVAKMPAKHRTAFNDIELVKGRNSAFGTAGSSVVAKEGGSLGYYKGIGFFSIESVVNNGVAINISSRKGVSPADSCIKRSTLVDRQIINRAATAIVEVTTILNSHTIGYTIDAVILIPVRHVEHTALFNRYVVSRSSIVDER